MTGWAIDLLLGLAHTIAAHTRLVTISANAGLGVRNVDYWPAVGLHLDHAHSHTRPGSAGDWRRRHLSRSPARFAHHWRRAASGCRQSRRHAADFAGARRRLRPLPPGGSVRISMASRTISARSPIATVPPMRAWRSFPKRTRTGGCWRRALLTGLTGPRSSTPVPKRTSLCQIENCRGDARPAGSSSIPLPSPRPAALQSISARAPKYEASLSKSGRIPGRQTWSQTGQLRPKRPALNSGG